MHSGDERNRSLEGMMMSRRVKSDRDLEVNVNICMIRSYFVLRSSQVLSAQKQLRKRMRWQLEAHCMLTSRNPDAIRMAAHCTLLASG